jgi:hypothetical protein
LKSGSSQSPTVGGLEKAAPANREVHLQTPGSADDYLVEYLNFTNRRDWLINQSIRPILPKEIRAACGKKLLRWRRDASTGEKIAGAISDVKVRAGKKPCGTIEDAAQVVANKEAVQVAFSWLLVACSAIQTEPTP